MKRLNMCHMAAWSCVVGIACIVLVAGCQDGSGPSLVTSPEGKPAYDGAKPPPPPQADPAIAFFLKRAGHPPYDLKVMNADGSNVTMIYSTPNINYGCPSWSPDGHSIAFRDRSDLYRIDVDVVNGVPIGTNARALVDRTTSIGAVAWSPLGGQIAFVDLGLRTIEAIPATGGVSVVLHTYSSGTVSSLAWSRDATQIALTQWDPSALRILDVATGVVTTAISPEWIQQFGSPEQVDWARTQDVLAFHINWIGVDQAVYIMQLPAGTPTRVTGGLWPSWSPNDQEILFLDRELKKIRLATGSITRLGGGGMSDWRRF